MPTITIPGARRLDVLGHRVYAKLKWEDEWELKEHVHATQVQFSCSPSVGSATLHYRFGIGRQPGQSSTSLWHPFTLPNLAYVRIDIDVRDIEADDETTIHWYGVAGRMVTRRDGSDLEYTLDPEPDPLPRPSGTQTLYCAGIEWLLDRWPILTTWTQYRPSAVFGQIREVWSGLIFNENLAPNRTEDLFEVPHFADRESYVFAYFRLPHPHLTPGEYWSTRDIVEYLLAFAVPYDAGGDYPIEWLLADDDELIPADDRPILPTEGRYTLGLLHQLLSRQRGYGFRFEISDHALDAGADAKIRLVPFTFVGTELELPSGAVIKANPLVRSLDISQDRHRSISTAEDAFSKYHRVIVRGNKMVACWSSQLYPSTALGRPFRAAWSTAAEVLYIAGYDGDYPLPDEFADQEVAIKQYRAQSRFEQVLARFEFHPYWPGWLDADTSVGSQISFPLPDAETTQAATYARGLRVLPILPMVVGEDYAADNTPEVDPAIDESHYLPPLTFWRLEPISSPPKYIEGRAIGTLAATETYGASHGDRGWYSITITLTPADGDNQAFDLVVSGDDRSVISPSGPYWRYDAAWVTVAVETPFYAEAQADTDVEPAEDVVRIKLIYAGSQYRLDWLAENTIVGLDADRAFIRSGDGRFIRDDRELLADIAKMALTWYGQDRQPINYQTSYLNSDLQVGLFIDELIDPAIDDPIPLNTVVTEITMEFPVASSAAPPLPTMTIRTAAAELDFV